MNSMKNLISQKAAASTGTITLGSTLPGFASFGAAFNDQDIVFYSVRDGNNREVGQGTYNNTNNTITRNVVFAKLDNSTYEEYPSNPLILSNNAIVSCAPSVEGGVYHYPVWKRIHSSVDVSNPSHSPDNPPLTEFKTGSGILIPAYSEVADQTAPLGFTIGQDVVDDTEFKVEVQIFTSGSPTNVGRFKLDILKVGISEVAPALVTETKDFTIDGVDETHQVLKFDTVLTIKPGMLISGSLTRLGAHTNDTYAGVIYLGGISGMYKASLLGTPSNDSTNFFNWN